MIAESLKESITSSPHETSKLNVIAIDRNVSKKLTEERGIEMSLCTGLSALIQAATSQLGQSTNEEILANTGLTGVDDYGSDLKERYQSSENIEATDDQTPSFPNLLMTLLLDPENIDTIAFLPDGSYFAIRTKEFSEGLLRQSFNLDSFEEFLALTQRWGFTRICGNDQVATSTSIQVFRHPCFRRGEREGLKLMKEGQKPDDARASAIPEKFSRIRLSLSEDSGLSSSKRRLSTSHIERDSQDSIQKSQKIVPEEAAERTVSVSSNDSETSHGRRRSSSKIRNYAMAVASVELDIQSGDSDDGTELLKTSSSEGKTSASLVEGGVERATHTIVTDAIETLLFDEGHTRETYLKHERELSKSSLPGVVPISKQLFSPVEGVANTISMTTETTMDSNDNS